MYKKGEKQEWVKPELIVLTQQLGDEVLTLDCKSHTMSVGPGVANNKCDAPVNQHNPCQACQAQNNLS